MTDKLEEALKNIPAYVRLEWGDYKPGPQPDAPPGSVVMGYDVPPPERVSVGLTFSEPGFGFGSIAIVQTKDGVFIDTERMSKAKVLKFVSALVLGAITDNDEEPEKHKRYNAAMGRQCSEYCKACDPNAPEPPDEL